MSGIENMVNSWLVEAPWVKVFKHTCDVLEDYVIYLLISVGTVCLSVRILTTLSAGDLVCVLIGETIKCYY